MSALELTLGWMGILVGLALLGGLLWRRHWRHLPIFTAFVVAQLLTQGPIALDPDRFYRWQFWLLHETVTAALRFGVALELANRIFRGFPGAAATALNGVLIVTALMATGIVGMYSPQATYSQIITEIVPGIAHGTAWILTILAMLTLWYRIPLAPMPKAILMGYAPYLLLFTVGRSLLGQMGWDLREEIGRVLVLAYMSLRIYWIWAAWTFPATKPLSEAFPPSAAAAVTAA
jgi:hypothetical protein